MSNRQNVTRELALQQLASQGVHFYANQNVFMCSACD